MYKLIDNMQRIQESEKLKLMIIPVSQLMSQSILQSIKYSITNRSAHQLIL